MKETLEEKLQRLQAEKQRLEDKKEQCVLDFDYRIEDVRIQIVYIQKEIERIQQATAA